MLKLLKLGIWMVVVPFCMGLLPLCLKNKKKEETVFSLPESSGFAFIGGYMIFWAIFELLAVPFILGRKSFFLLAFLFEMICLVLAFAGIGFFCKNYAAGSRLSGLLKKKKRSELFLWAVFLASLLFQLYMSYTLAYADGDDAYYVSISTAANLGGTMYQTNPYTGMTTEIEMRYGLAPFPIWVSFIAEKCGVNAAVAAHSLIPLILIPLTYVIYLEIGKLLCGEKQEMLPIFMTFVSLLQIFGNYSIYPASTFLLTRTRQGKAALGNVILPFLILLLLRMSKEVKERGRAEKVTVCWIFVTMLSGALCSTMSGFLCGLLVMLTAGLFALLYRKPRVLLQCFAGCIPGICASLLYMILK